MPGRLIMPTDFVPKEATGGKFICSTVVLLDYALTEDQERQL
jgi:hypothetical protein